MTLDEIDRMPTKSNIQRKARREARKAYAVALIASTAIEQLERNLLRVTNNR